MLHPAFDVDGDAPPLARRAAEAVLRSEHVEPRPNDLRIHADDPVFNHLLNLGHAPEYAVGAYFHNALEARTLLDRLVASLVRPPANVLDFASGFGRIARFVARRLPPGGLDSADVLDGAAAFNVANFGVGAFDSTIDPEAVRFPRRYDLIFVFSLFTHLPKARARGWIRRLREALTDDGTLLITTHGISYGRRFGIVPPEGAPPDFHFEARSEIPAFDPAEYGVACFRKTAFRRLLAANGFGVGAVSERGVWDSQDVYVASADGSPRVAPPPAPRGSFARLDLRRDGAFDGEAVVDAAPETPSIAGFYPALDGRDGPRIEPPRPEAARNTFGAPVLRYRVRCSGSAAPFEGPQVVGLVAEHRDGARRLVAGQIAAPR